MDKVFGIDISVWQDDNSTPQRMDFTKARAEGAEFVFIKASERMGADADFIWNWKNAKEAGLLRGAYHFLRWDISGAQQARFFCDLIKDDPGELPPVADFEAPPKFSSSTEVSHWPSNSLLFQFLEVVEDTLGVKPMIYTSPRFWNTYGKIKNTGSFDQKWAYYPLWIANYTKADGPVIPKPWKDWKFWQYSANGDGLKFGAESKSIDLNWFNGDLVDLYSFAGIGEIEPPIDPDIPPVQDIDTAIRLGKLENWARGIGYSG